MIKKAFFVFFCFLSSCQIAFAQFTAVQTGPMVSENLETFGVAWIDYDNDGDDDLFVTTTIYSSDPSVDLLYRNNGDGTFTKIITGELVNEPGTGRNSSWGDYDNDGYIDVFVANQHTASLFRNQSGEFTRILTLPSSNFNFESDHSGAAWGDYDADGFLDLFMASYKLNDNARNALFHNDRDGTFSQLPGDHVVSQNGPSQDPTWIDYDNNGTLDLFVPNYGATNYLYANQGAGVFQSVTSSTFLLNELTVASSWADYDNDGDFDFLAVANANSPSKLFENNGDGTFKLTSGIPAILAISATWGDFDNDGWIDAIIVGANPLGPNSESKIILYRNNGDKTFTNVTAAQGITTDNTYSISVANADYDNDGFLDFFAANAHGDNLTADDMLYHNTPNSNGYLALKLKGKKFNRSAIGATVKVKAGGRWQMRTVQSKTGYGAQNSLRIHLGLGVAEKADSVMIIWPQNGYQILTDVTKNQLLNIEELDFPAKPGNLNGVNTKVAKVTLTWLDQSLDETGFRIERSKSNQQNFKVVANIAANTLTWEDSGLEEGATYYYRLSASTNGGYSAYTPTASIYVKKTQTITFNAIGEKFLDSSPFALAATSTSGLPVSFTILEGSENVSLSGNTLSIKKLGVSKLGASHAGNELYHPAEQVTQELNVSIITGLEKSANLNTIVYPNPFNDQLTIHRTSAHEEFVKLVSAAGQALVTFELRNEKETLSLKDLPDGLYVLVFRDQRIKVLKR